jgi:hypothetical protein
LGIHTETVAKPGFSAKKTVARNGSLNSVKMNVLKFIIASMVLPFILTAQTVDVTFTPITVDDNTLKIEVRASCPETRYLSAIPSGWNYEKPNNLENSDEGWELGPGVLLAPPKSYNFPASTLRFGHSQNPNIPAVNRFKLTPTPQLIGTFVIDNIQSVTFPFHTAVRTSGAVSLQVTTFPNNSDFTGVITHTLAGNNLTVGGSASPPQTVFTAPVASGVNADQGAGDFRVVNVFPVPTDDMVTLQVNLPQFANLTVSVTDLNGRLLQVSDMELLQGLSDVQVDLSSFAAGTYFVKIDNGVTQLTQQIVKQ